MESIELKDYLHKIFNLEIAVYTQNRVIEKYSNDRENNKPKQKIISKISPPQKPDKSYFDSLKFYLQNFKYAQSLDMKAKTEFCRF